MNDFFEGNFHKEITPTLELLRATYDHVDKNWQGKVIKSQYSRLYFIKKGYFYIIDNEGNRTNFNEGGAYLIPSGYSYVYGCETENEIFSLHLRLYNFDNIDLLSRFEKPVFCQINADLDRLAEIIYNKGVTAQLTLRAEIYRVLSEIAINSHGLLDAPSYSSDINEAIKYISAHLSARLSVSEIARAVNLAISTLSSKFKREVGMSIGEYVDYRVILSAAKMLLSERGSILEISEKLGFCDQFYFSRRFKQRYGISPQKFRKYKYI